MNKQNLGNLKEIDLRDVWKTEPYHFTIWLAKEENLALLSESLGINLKLKGTEVQLKGFKVDILAEEEETGELVTIENQLTNTDHDH